MTPEGIVLRENRKEAYTIDDWFKYMQAGYIGMQSGNLRHIFILGGDKNSNVIFERTLNDDDLFKRMSFDRTDQLDVHNRMTRVDPRRRYWVFDRDYIKIATVKDTIYRVRGTDRVKKQPLNKLKIIQLKYDKELL